MTNNVGTPLFYTYIAMFGIFFIYVFLKFGETPDVVKTVVDAVTEGFKGGSARKRHKKR